MAKGNNSKTILIIVAIVLGILIIGGFLFGYGCYYLYKTGRSTASPSLSKVDTGSWKYYNNGRFGFTMNYPNTFSEQEAANGDGVVLTMQTPGISVDAYAANNWQNQTLDQYINAVREDLFAGQAGAEELMAKSTTLDGIPAEERRWQYVNSIDGSQTIMEQVTAQKGENFYTLQMVVSYANFPEYAPMFDEILKTFKFV